MIVYRLCKAGYATVLSGEGARRTGGRWNSKGIPMIYTSESRSLCTAEMAVHLPLGILPAGFVMMSIEIPGQIPIIELEPAELPETWKSFPHHPVTQGKGDEFIRKAKFAVMKVPSAVVPGDHNYLLNPDHKLFNEPRILKTEPFDFDQRLFLK
jgi:RES domain-containing protein